MKSSILPPPSGIPTLKSKGEAPDAALRKAARDLESVFLAEMLKSAGLHESPDGFGGGEGEDQFKSLLVRAQADAIVDAGGIGLAESLYDALKERANAE